ncbi:acyl-CoA:lysophosphatidylglycerol acyltransferase 1-like isoform X2 [Amphibalanus amphitrite]|nr:acyl-CoA:lysophosphatidylglycerol acyltransferase 1-like isoform X2 [Amphibalanus amphitrite]XP_043235728.1 acyl-CoA:lysophosphatidylglycerol acyltransferase 1-like isoform X2 [Amphibalanus amphitrite]XP_043235729.1 acyl-CoA:lysophosphatidylglycerol acyltransferase 1-like isoform X2 [Amphibalanus amphitrite]XP_043235730.1 acyl-CoA:lysophosphatidylglycerol acyltransferase 1-like isoform X2 [Amphibalanus amphitrite]
MAPLLQRCAHYGKCALRLLLFLLNNLYCIPSYTVWMFLLRPLLWVAPELYWRIEGVLFRWLLHMVAMLSYTAGYDVIEMGDRIDHLEQENCLFIVNHQSTADVPVLMNMLTAHGRAADNAMWIMDVQFKWSNFGVVSQIHRDFFIECGREKRDRSVELLRSALIKDYVGLNRKWILLFPEGGFLKNRKPVSQRFAEKNGLPHLERVSLPRVGAARAVLDLRGSGTTPEPTVDKRPNGHGPPAAAAETSGGQGDSVSERRVKWVVDLTVAYPDQADPLGLMAVMAGSRPPCKLYFYYRVYRSDQVPTDPEDLTTWLYQLFFDKEAQLDEYYRTGKMPTLPPEKHGGRSPVPPPRRIRHDPAAWLLRHLFFIASTVVQWRMMVAVAGAAWSAAAAVVPLW